MSEPTRALPLVLLLGPVALGMAAARAGAGVDPARCAAIGAASERLACYDASGCAGIATTEERLACYDALANRKSSAIVTAPPPTPRPEAAGNDAGSFGLVKPQPVAPQGPQKIDARIVSVTSDRQGHVTLTLDNGQTWAVNEAEPQLRSGDTVTIRHAALGSYLLTSAAHRSYRVQRLR